MQTIISLRPGMTAAVSGTVLNAGLAQTRRPGFRLFSALVQDESGQIQAVWPNQAFLKDVIKSQQRIVLFGKVEIWGSRGLQITDPEFEIVKESGIGDQGSGSRTSAAAYRPHRSGLRAHRQRDDEHAAPIRVAGARRSCLTTEFDPVPDDILKRERWPGRKAALWAAHFPSQDANVDRAERVHDAGAAAAGLRRLLRVPDRARAPAARERAGPQGAGVESRRSHSPVCARGAAVQADGRAARCARRDRRGHAARVADAAAAAGRRRRRQDDRRAAGGDRGDGERLPGRLHGADRDPRRAALPDDRQGARTARPLSRRAAERARHRGDAPRSAAGDRARRDQSRRRHAGADPAARQVQGAGARA